MDKTVKSALTTLSRQLESYSETPKLDAQVLLAHVMGQSRSWILAHPDAHIDRRIQKDFEKAAARLERGEPLPYIIGHWEFYGLDFELSPEVLIPRPETELLVERAIGWLKLHPFKRKVVDIGTGSGCIGIAIATHVPEIHLVMTDISLAGLSVARKNAIKYNLHARIDFVQSDLLDGISGAFDLICANLPYIPTLIFEGLPIYSAEPHLAVDGGHDGTELISRLLGQSGMRMASGGLLLLEIDPSQVDKLTQLVKFYFPSAKVQVIRDLTGRDRCLEIERIDQIVHICQSEDWDQALKRGEYRAHSLGEAGYIHCSLPRLCLQVANRYYQGLHDLLILQIEVEKVRSEVRWERAGDELFPHVYGPINLDAVVGVIELKPDGGGIFRAEGYQ